MLLKFLHSINVESHVSSNYDHLQTGAFFSIRPCSNASHGWTFGANQLQPKQNQSDEQDLTLHYKHRLMISLALFFIEMTRQKMKKNSKKILYGNQLIYLIRYFLSNWNDFIFHTEFWFFHSNQRRWISLSW